MRATHTIRPNYRLGGRAPVEDRPPWSERALPSKPGRALPGLALFLGLAPVFFASRRAAKFSMRRFCLAACASCSERRLSFLGSVVCTYQALVLFSLARSRRLIVCFSAFTLSRILIPSAAARALPQRSDSCIASRTCAAS